MQNRRGEGRFTTRFDSLISSGRTEVTGVLADISCTGALVEESTLKPQLGKTIRLYVFVQPIAPFEVVGTVVRHTGSGFAIGYEDLSDEVRRLVSEAAAVVAKPLDD